MSEDQRLEHIENKIDELDRKISDIDNDLARYRGMVGGILLAVTAIVSFVKFFWNFLMEHVK